MMIEGFARWLLQFDEATIYEWMLAILVLFWGSVGIIGYHLIQQTGVMYP